MDAQPTSSAQVLVIGAGPTGLMLACGLAQRGVDVRIVDRKDGLSTLVKASEVTPRSLEALEDFGIVERAHELGVIVHSFKIYAHGKPVLQAQYGELESPYKYQVHLGQPHTEKLLFEHLQELGGNVEWNVELTSFRDEGDGVTAALRHGDGREEVAEAAYLAACDGANSTVRKALGLELKGHTYPADNLIGNAKLEWDRPPDEVYVFLSDEGEMTVNPLPDGYHQIGGAFRLKDGEASKKGQDATLDELQAMFDRRSAIPGRLSEAERVNYYWAHHRAIDRQVNGRIFLLGDAAHMVSPDTGLGMNTGLQDAHNLAWKLHLVLARAAAPSLLETFQDERHGILGALGQFSDADEFLYLMQNPVAKELRDHLVPYLMSWKPVFERQTRTMTQTDVAYRKSPIVAQDLGFPFHWPGATHLGEHASCPSTWFQFAEGPHAGDRACDIRPVRGSDPDKIRLFDYLRHDRHTLLLFLACTEPETELRRALDAIETGTQRDFGHWIETCLVVPDSEPPKHFDWPGKMVFDLRGFAHNRYGARGECLYLVRPDKFIGYRSLPPDWDKLAAYLETVIFRQPEPEGRGAA